MRAWSGSRIHPFPLRFVEFFRFDRDLLPGATIDKDRLRGSEPQGTSCAVDRGEAAADDDNAQPTEIHGLRVEVELFEEMETAADAVEFLTGNRRSHAIRAASGDHDRVMPGGSFAEPDIASHISLIVNLDTQIGHCAHVVNDRLAWQAPPGTPPIHPSWHGIALVDGHPVATKRKFAGGGQPRHARANDRHRAAIGGRDSELN